MKNTIVACVLVATSCLAMSQIKRLPLGFGQPDCGQWLASEQPTERHRAWLMGAMSGLNYGVALGLSISGKSLPQEPFEKVSSEQLILWMNNYCRANPLKSVGTGMESLYQELLK